MLSFRRLGADPLRTLKVLEGCCFPARSVCVLHSLSALQIPVDDCRKKTAPNCIHSLPEQRGFFQSFGSSAIRYRGGYGQSETDRSLRRRGTVQEEQSASASEDELEEMDNIPSGEGEPTTRLSPFAERDKSSPRQSRERFRPAQQPQNLDSAEDRRSIHLAPYRTRDHVSDAPEQKLRGLQQTYMERVNQGSIDPFAESSIPKQEMEEWVRGFRMKVIDVNRINRGSRTGGIGRFSALAVVGNSDGVLGLGMGKALAISDAILKAHNEALRTLFFVPRYKDATILHPVKARFGKSKVTMYPRSTGSGCKASTMISSVCQLAGIHDIGVKVHGTRNVRNTVKALIRGFESQLVEQELVDIPAVSDKLAQSMPKRQKGLPTVASLSHL